MTDRHGEWSQCERCGYPSQITRSVAFGGFLCWNGEIVLCWNGRECLLRLRRKRASPTPPAAPPHPAATSDRRGRYADPRLSALDAVHRTNADA